MTEVIADNVTFLGSRQSNGGGSYAPSESMSDNAMPTMDTDDVPFPTGEEMSTGTTDVSEDPFKDFGDEVVLSDDDLPF